MKPVQFQPAFVLHRRAYRETSLLVELLSKDHGRLTVLAKGARKLKSTSQGLLQSFTPLLVSWTGKGELMLLAQVEARGSSIPLKGECLFAGLYLNELLTYLLQKWDPHANLFQAYENTLLKLQGEKLQIKLLRSFEIFLLEELGYGLLPKSEMLIRQAFLADKYYQFTSEQGFTLTEEGTGLKFNTVFSGRSLIAIAKEQWDNQETLQDAKRLIRFALMPLLDGHQLMSRRLFVSPVEGNKNE